MAKNKQSEDLEHSVGGVTTRSDALDLGVPMLAGDANEPQGPEDALGPGPKRGDYRDRIGPSNYYPHQSVPIPPDEQEEGGPTVRVEAQRPRVDNIGEVAGKKGGVETSE